MQAVTKIKTVWRNSACLMLLSGNFKYRKQSVDELVNILDRKVLPNFIETSSESGTVDEELLFVQRHSKSGFMANTHVFPGGVIDEADFSPKWINIFSELSHCATKNVFASIVNFKCSSAPRLPLYSTVPSSIQGEIAFRICAIREMFEEAGVLLARDKNEIEAVLNLLPGSFKPAVKVLPDKLLEHWRKRVHSNANEFLKMCRELECVPDIWSLIEWSNWLTPRNSKRRYDTVFYMCFVEMQPPPSPDGVETTSATWISPRKANELFLSQKILLAPPQFAELKTLERFFDASCLHSYALHEMISGGSGYRRYSARMATQDDVIISVRECDDLYPFEGSEDWTTEIQHPQSISLRDEVSLVLSDHYAFEYVIPSHSAQKLADLSQHLCRMEFHPSSLRFLDNQTENKISDYEKRFKQQPLKEIYHISKL